MALSVCVHVYVIRGFKNIFVGIYKYFFVSCSYASFKFVFNTYQIRFGLLLLVCARCNICLLDMLKSNWIYDFANC